jgi:spore coat protein A
MDFFQIGVDQGFIERAVKVNYVFLGPAERADIIVDFNEARGRNVELLNQASNGTFPFLDGEQIGLPGKPATLCTDGSVMQFRVGRRVKKSDNHGRVPGGRLFDYEGEFPDLNNVRTRKFNLKVNFNQFGPNFLINDAPFVGRVDPVIPLGTTEIWEFINTIPTAHPMHVHMVGFYVVNRQQFNSTAFLNNPLGDNDDIQFLGPPRNPPPTERGVKDVAVVFPNEVLRIVATFGPYTGEFVYHCHLLEHEDNDMMRRYAVGPVGPDCQWDDDEQDKDCSYYD